MAASGYVRNRSGQDREISVLGLVVRAGEVGRVPDSLVGHAPKGDDPGTGLLAQSETWERATKADFDKQQGKAEPPADTTTTKDGE